MRFLLPAGVLLVGLLLGWFVLSTNSPTSSFSLKLGLDLAGGTHLVYRAETGALDPAERPGALSSLREVIERRVNLFGVAEPLVQVEESSIVAGAHEDRLIVELPGVTDIDAAVDAIGKTPLLEFKIASAASETSTPVFVPTELTGRYLSKASLQFGAGQGSLSNEPIVVLTFNDDGAELFSAITTENVGETLAIFLDGSPISTPVIQEPIPGGVAQISGDFTPEAARDLVQNLNFGALPVAIGLVGSNTIGPTLGEAAINAGMIAGVVGLILVGLFMLLWYRLPGLVADIALLGYLALVIAAMKFIPVTLTASGIAGLIVSIGMAVDANVLIFERIKEELRLGKGPHEAVGIGFSRAWPAIRDGHLTMLISAVILFWLGTSIVQGFALVFALGVVASLITAVSVSRMFLFTVLPETMRGAWKFLLGSGFRLPTRQAHNP